MLTELAETDARGRIADIFAEIRHLYGVPYVSSIHRHMATRPGVLEWAWELTGPLFRSGVAQETAWAIARDVRLARMPQIPAEALAVWGVAPDDVPTIGAIAESFTRVAPLNLVFGGLVRATLLDARVAAVTENRDIVRPTTGWSPPAALPPPPAFATAEALGETGLALLARFRSGSGTTAFVPGLYRMLARWPGLLAHLAVELGPRFEAAEKAAVAAGLIARVDAAVCALRGDVHVPALAPPAADEARHLVGMIDGYRVTSPEMILFGRLIRDAVGE